MTRPTSVVTSALTATLEVATSEDGLVSAAIVDSVDAAVSAVLDSATFSVECSVVVDSDDSATVEVVVVVGAMVDSVSDSFTTFGSLKLSGCSVEDSVVDVDSVAASVDVAALGSSEEEDRDSDTSVVCVFSSISSDVEVDVVVVDVDVDMVEDSEEAESTLSLDSSAVEVESVVELVRVSELERSEVSVVEDSSTVDRAESVDAVSNSWTLGSVTVEGAVVVVKVPTSFSALNCSSVSPSAPWSRPSRGTSRWIMWT